MCDHRFHIWSLTHETGQPLKLSAKALQPNWFYLCLWSTPVAWASYSPRRFWIFRVPIVLGWLCDVLPLHSTIWTYHSYDQVYTIEEGMGPTPTLSPKQSTGHRGSHSTGKGPCWVWDLACFSQARNTRHFHFTVCEYLIPNEISNFFCPVSRRSKRWSHLFEISAN